jgi:hypothetical protein
MDTKLKLNRHLELLGPFDNSHVIPLILFQEPQIVINSYNSCKSRGLNLTRPQHTKEDKVIRKINVIVLEFAC